MASRKRRRLHAGLFVALFFHMRKEYSADKSEFPLPARSLFSSARAECRDVDVHLVALLSVTAHVSVDPWVGGGAPPTVTGPRGAGSSFNSFLLPGILKRALRDPLRSESQLGFTFLWWYLWLPMATVLTIVFCDGNETN